MAKKAYAYFSSTLANAKSKITGIKAYKKQGGIFMEGEIRLTNSSTGGPVFVYVKDGKNRSYYTNGLR